MRFIKSDSITICIPLPYYVYRSSSLYVLKPVLPHFDVRKAEKSSKSRRGGSSDANPIALVNKFSYFNSDGKN